VKIERVGMGQKKQVNVALDYDQYERWSQEVEENGQYATMSDLVRMSVEKELSRDNTQTSQVGGKEVAKLSERVEAIENAIQGLSGDFQELKGIVESQSPTNQNLKSEAFAVLPESDGLSNRLLLKRLLQKLVVRWKLKPLLKC
jgi:Arc/MetJ-type ribon-helix-helix transcriptional regulator